MKRLKVVAWDILNKASIQVGALRGWVFVNAIKITFVKFVFCNFSFHYRIKKIGVGLLKNRSTRMTRRMRGPSSLISTKPSSSRQRLDELWQITFQFPWPLLVSLLCKIITVVKSYPFFSALLHLCNEENLSLKPSDEMEDFTISMP